MGAALSAYHAAQSRLVYAVIFWGNSCEWKLIESSHSSLLQSSDEMNSQVLCLEKHRDSCKPYFRSSRILTFPSIYIPTGSTVVC